MNAHMVLQEHHPARPSWRCEGCYHPFPCWTAREQLIAEFGGHTPALAEHSTDLLYVAVSDLGPGADPRTLFERFVAWTCPF